MSPGDDAKVDGTTTDAAIRDLRSTGGAPAGIRVARLTPFAILKQAGRAVTSLLFLLTLMMVMAVGCAADAAEPVVGGPCEGCEYVFVGLPEAIEARSTIASSDVPGEPLAIEGTVRRADGTAAAGIIVYAYHTDRSGVYPRGMTAHGALRGWVRTDAAGHYRFDTIRPGAYPGQNIPQHVHMHVIEPGRATYYIDDIVFDDDPLLTAGRRREYRHGRGGTGLVHPDRDAAGVWHVRRDITLGQGVPGYELRGRGDATRRER